MVVAQQARSVTAINTQPELNIEGVRERFPLPPPLPLHRKMDLTENQPDPRSLGTLPPQIDWSKYTVAPDHLYDEPEFQPAEGDFVKLRSS